MLHRCQLCVEIRGGYVEDVGAQKVQDRKYIIIPIITKVNLDNLQ